MQSVSAAVRLKHVQSRPRLVLVPSRVVQLQPAPPEPYSVERKTKCNEVTCVRVCARVDVRAMSVCVICMCVYSLVRVFSAAACFAP